MGRYKFAPWFNRLSNTLDSINVALFLSSEPELLHLGSVHRSVKKMSKTVKNVSKHVKKSVKPCQNMSKKYQHLSKHVLFSVITLLPSKLRNS